MLFVLLFNMVLMLENVNWKWIICCNGDGCECDIW